jgi:hypothetical protein
MLENTLSRRLDHKNGSGRMVEVNSLIHYLERNIINLPVNEINHPKVEDYVDAILKVKENDEIV